MPKRVLQGVVVSDKGEKTVVVKVDFMDKLVEIVLVART